MSTKKNIVRVSNLEVKTVKKDIKNIHIGVYPPNGRVRVAAPLKINDDSLRLLIISKIPWIKKQQLRFIKQERQTKREYVSGESHYFMGSRYILNIIYDDSKPRVEINRKNIINLHVKSGTSSKKREKLLEDFYRSELRKCSLPLIKKWEKTIGIQVKELRIKKMKTKWGTSNPDCQRIWINLELVKKPLNCLEYVLVHEMVHFLETKHGDKFKYLLSSFLPQWQKYKEELNQMILGYHEWNN